MSRPPFLTPKSQSLEEFVAFLFKALIGAALVIAAYRLALSPGFPDVPKLGIGTVLGWLFKAKRGP